MALNDRVKRETTELRGLTLYGEPSNISHSNSRSIPCESATPITPFPRFLASMRFAFGSLHTGVVQRQASFEGEIETLTEGTTSTRVLRLA
jgi:hypothetical protein